MTTGEKDEEGQFQELGCLVSLIPLHLNKGCVPHECQRGVLPPLPGHLAAEVLMGLCK